jgi:hypothetical protein
MAASATLSLSHAPGWCYPRNWIQKFAGLVMSPSFEPIHGKARIELRDLVIDTLILAVKRVGFSSLFVLAIIGFSVWYLYADFADALRTMNKEENDEMWNAIRLSLLPLVQIGAPFLVLTLVIWAVVLPAIALWHIGRDRRTLTWVVDETGIRRTDALGAESLLPWSNIQKVKVSRRMLWLKLRPNGWRYLLRRAFAAEDQARLEQLARRMVS